jgi:hypothetical protein
MRLALLLLGSLYANAQSGIEVPSIGAIVYPAGALRLVQGVAGNFLVGQAAISGVLSAACSEQLCLAKTDSKLLSATGETSAPAGPAVFGLDRDNALVFFAESRTFARWRDNALEPLDWIVDGEVLAIRVRGEETEIAVRRDGTVWIVHPDGAIIDSIGEAAGPVLLLDEGVILATWDQVILRRRGNDSDASEIRFELADAKSIIAMGPHYAAIRAGDAIYVLRTDSGRESLFELPGTTP